MPDETWNELDEIDLGRVEEIRDCYAGMLKGELDLYSGKTAVTAGEIAIICRMFLALVDEFGEEIGVYSD